MFDQLIKEFETFAAYLQLYNAKDSLGNTIYLHDYKRIKGLMFELQQEIFTYDWRRFMEYKEEMYDVYDSIGYTL